MSRSFPLPHQGVDLFTTQRSEMQCLWVACVLCWRLQYNWSGKVMSRTSYLSPNEGGSWNTQEEKSNVAIHWCIVLMLPVLLLLQLYYTIVYLCENIRPRERSRQVQRPYHISHALTHEVVSVCMLTPLTSECDQEGNGHCGALSCA